MLRRRWKPLLLVALLAAGGVGGYLYSVKRETGEVARALWQELDNYDHEEAVTDPIFADLKPGDGKGTEKNAAQPTPPASTEKPASPAPTVEKTKPAPTPQPSAGRLDERQEPLRAQPQPKTAQVPATKAATPPVQKPQASATPTPAPAQTPATHAAPAQVQATQAQPAQAQTPPTPTPKPQAQAAPAQPPSTAPTPGRYDAGSPRPNPYTNNVHILLIGNDQERIGGGRADSIMLVTLNPDRRVLEIVSVPRDTWVDIPGRGFDKVNHAYQFGGADLLNHTLQRFFGFPFQYYVEISQGGFRSMIDQVGGVDVDVPFTFTYEGHTFTKGPMHLNGETALAYSRMRKLDPRGAFGREDRQKQIVGALLRRLGEIPLGDTVRLNALARDLIPFVRTDLGPRKVVTLRHAHPYALDRTVRLEVQGRGQMLKGIYYFMVPDAERRRLHLALR